MWKIESFICGGIFDLASKEAKVKALETEMEAPTFWDDNDAAQKVIAECNALKAWTIPYHDLKERYSNVSELLQEAFDLGEESLIQELVEELDSIEASLKELEIRKMLAGELDSKNAFLSINAGAGGTEACDWVLMLSRMYQRWAAKKNWKVEVIDTVDGDVAGIKSITYKFTGPFAYGYAKAEKGVHRLVRISPFDSNAKRHTSFASVDITPEITDDIQIEIRPEDLRVDTFRASGAGGQHVNRTDSAVRLTHLPTGIVVSCQAQRSQLQNKETCYKMLRSKLYEMEVTARENALKAMGGEKKEIAWGSQIRNYVFQPYTLVKDTRTKVECGNIQAVMDGELDDFVNAYLMEFGG
ncbi:MULTISPECIES: peptide chain release factor 2 [Parachlamydia]|uniref:Peptide chain release factor 2 n=1 Tax=Parachlamydia acanthamoebae TaxID=83552 RepID=A0A0C1BY88_9BACT|nr:Peptide chain release factor 2 [Parachlamydia acanthamoebae]